MPWSQWRCCTSQHDSSRGPSESPYRSCLLRGRQRANGPEPLAAHRSKPMRALNRLSSSLAWCGSEAPPARLSARGRARPLLGAAKARLLASGCSAVFARRVSAAVAGPRLDLRPRLRGGGPAASSCQRLLNLRRPIR